MGSTGNTGGVKGAEPLEAQEVVGILSHKDVPILRPFCNMTRLYGYFHSRTKQTCIHFKLAEPDRSFNLCIATVAVVPLTVKF